MSAKNTRTTKTYWRAVGILREDHVELFLRVTILGSKRSVAWSGGREHEIELIARHLEDLCRVEVAAALAPHDAALGTVAVTELQIVTYAVRIVNESRIGSVVHAGRNVEIGLQQQRSEPECKVADVRTQSKA